MVFVLPAAPESVKTAVSTSEENFSTVLVPWSWTSYPPELWELNVYCLNLSFCVCLVTQSCPTFYDRMDCSPPGSSVHGDSAGQNTGVGCHVLLQRIFPTQSSNPGLPHCRQILYHLSLQGSPRILEWVAYPFSRGSSWLGNWIGVSCFAGGFFTSWATREAFREALILSYFVIVAQTD